MSDFTTMRLLANTGTDASPTWTTWSFGGTGNGANELRFCAAGAGAASTPSASWPYLTRPGTVQVVGECWIFTSDTSGTKCLADGTNTKANTFCVDFDATGTFAAAPILTAYSDSSHAAAVPGTQPGAQAGSPIINGSADTGNTSYLKGNMYGTAQTANLSAGSVGTSLSATSGTAGAAIPSAGAWLANWQSLQAMTQYLQFPSVPPATTAGRIYFGLVLYVGPGMSTGGLLPVLTWQYAYS